MIQFPSFLLVPCRLQKLDHSCGVLAAWGVLRYFHIRTSAECLIQACRHAETNGVFSIALAVALKEQGLVVTYRSDPDPAPHSVELRCFRRAEELGIPIGRAIELEEVLAQITPWTIPIVLYKTDDGNAHFSPIVGYVDDYVYLPYAETDEMCKMPREELLQRWNAPGIFRQCVMVSGPNPLTPTGRTAEGKARREGVSNLNTDTDPSEPQDLLARFHAAREADERETIVESALEADADIVSALLIAALDDIDQSVRYAGATQAGSAGLPHLVAVLLRVLEQDRDSMVRVAAAESLGMIGDVMAVPALIHALNDRSPLVRGWAASSLAEFPGSRSTEALHERLGLEKRHFVRANILFALISLGESDLLSSLISELRSRNGQVRCATTNMLAELANVANSLMIVDALDACLRRERLRSVKATVYRALEEMTVLEERSIEILEKEIARDPDDMLPVCYLCKALVRRKDLEAARRWGQTLVAGHFKNAAVFADDPEIELLIS